MEKVEPSNCPHYSSCNKNICPFDKDVESRVGHSGEKCGEFPSIKGLLKTEQVEVYIRKLNTLKEDK